MSRLLFLFPVLSLFISLNLNGQSNTLPSFSELAEVSSPAVINISSKKIVKKGVLGGVALEDLKTH